MSATHTPAATLSGKAKFLRNLKITLIVTALVLLSAVVMVIVTWIATGKPQGAATWASMPAIVTIVAAFAGGRGFAVRVAIIMGMLTPITIVAGMSPVSGAALMAVMIMMVGYLSRFGLHKSGLLVPVMLSWALINPPTWNGATEVNRLDESYLLWMTLIFFIGGLIPALIVPWLMRKKDLPQLQTHSGREVLTYSVMMVVLVTVATYFVLSHPENIGGAFLIAAIMVMAPIGTASTLKPTVIRVVSTVVGSVLVILLLPRVDSLTVIYLFGLLFLIVAMMSRLSGSAWLYFVFMVPATAALNATTVAEVSELSKQRVYDNIAGGVIVLIAAALAIGYSNWADRHKTSSDADPEVEALTQSSGQAPVPSSA